MFDSNKHISLARQKGFGLIGAVVAVVIAVILILISLYLYNLKVIKAQSFEAFAEMESKTPQIATNLKKFGKCTPNGESETSTQKYGSISISGTADPTSLNQPGTKIDTGCDITYTFNGNSSSRWLAGTVIQADVFNNMTLFMKRIK